MYLICFQRSSKLTLRKFNCAVNALETPPSSPDNAQKMTTFINDSINLKTIFKIINGIRDI